MAHDLGGGVVLDERGVVLGGDLVLRPPFDWDDLARRAEVVPGTDVRGEVDCWTVRVEGVTWRVQVCDHHQGWVVILNHDSLPWPDESAVSVPWGRIQCAEGIQSGVRCWFGWYQDA